MNSNFILTMVDTMQIQSYIFASSKLKEIVGASELVRKTTQEWLVEAIYRQCDSADKIKNGIELHKLLIEQKPIEEGARFEIIYCGGGNAKILFQKEDDALKVINNWSRKMLEEAPGLKIAVVHHLFEWNPNESFSNVIDKAEQELARKSNQFADHIGNLATPFVVRCTSSGLPANGHDKQDENSRLSTQAQKKREAAQKSLAEIWGLLDNKKFAFPLNLDELGMKEGSAYIGIIHADGNRMREKLINLAHKAPPRQYINDIRQFSINLAEVSKSTFECLLGWISENYNEWTNPGSGILNLTQEVVSDPSQNLYQKYYLPVRPIIIGGDDFTAVVPGKIALAASVFYQKAFNNVSKDKKYRKFFGKSGLSASSGVAIVHSHHPFDKAYILAESLSASAKMANIDVGKNQSWIDWYIATDSDVAEVNILREKKYRYTIEGQSVKLTMKPYRVDTAKGGISDFDQFQNDVCSLQQKDKFPRKKLKQLFDSCTEGPEESRVVWQTISTSLTKSQKKEFEKIFERYHGKSDSNMSELFKTTNMGSNISHQATAILDLIESLEFVLSSNGGDK